MDDALPTSDVIGRVSALLGETPCAWRSVHGGYTPAKRWVVETKKGAAFVKLATSPTTANLLRRELFNYSTLKLPMMPRFIGGEDHPEAPLLIIEDLSRAIWPPPWDGDRLERVMAAIRDMHSARAPLRTYAQVHGVRAAGWPVVAADPKPFLSLGVVTAVLLRSESALSLTVEPSNWVRQTFIRHAAIDH